MAGQWVTAAKTGEIPVGQFKPVVIGERRLLICHTDGGCYAIDDTCTHDEGPLADGWLEGHEIECPRHGARFDVRTGKVLCLPAAAPISSYRMQIVGEEVRVALEDPVPR
jgi:3-phenylpropionate/trans-cinnamate dioxygenase ferredoxin subunit